MSGVRHPSPWGPRGVVPTQCSLSTSAPCSPRIQSPGPSSSFPRRRRSGVRSQVSASPLSHRGGVGCQPSHQCQGLGPPLCKATDLYGPMLSIVPLFFNILGFWFFSSPLHLPLGKPWPRKSLGVEPPCLLLPQNHRPGDALTHRGGQSPSRRAALGPEAAAGSPLLLLPRLTPPFRFHG